MDYLRSDGLLVMREATHNVKKQAEYFTILLFVASQATPVL